MSVRRSERSIYVNQANQPLRRGRFRTLLPVLVLLSIALLALSRLDHPAVREIRWRVAEFMTPILGAILVPLEPVRRLGQHIPDLMSMTEELEKLRDENQTLKGWEWRARETERKLLEISALARAVPEKAMDFVTVRIVANSSGAFVRSAMINAGAEQNLKEGFPVLSGDGLIGRVVETGSTAARILFITDHNSRIPVLVGADAINAILVGDNGPAPRLAYAAGEAVFNAGDEVSTSGAGGMFPRGLRIGVVIETPQGPRVRPHAKLDAVEYASVLFYAAPLLNGPSATPPAAVPAPSAGAATEAGEGNVAAGGGAAPSATP